MTFNGYLFKKYGDSKKISVFQLRKREGMNWWSTENFRAVEIRV